MDAAVFEITTDDVREACDVFRPLYESTGRLDGRVSIEVDPRLAHDSEGTIEAARRLAERALHDGGDSDAARLDFIVRRLLARSLTTEELVVAAQSLGQLIGYYREHVDDAKAVIGVGQTAADATIEPAALAGWTMLANELMNLNEVLNK